MTDHLQGMSVQHDPENLPATTSSADSEYAAPVPHAPMSALGAFLAGGHRGGGRAAQTAPLISALQRSIGNRATRSMIQRYRQVDTNGYNANVGVNPQDGPMFTTASPDPHITADKEIRYAMASTSNKVPLLVANDNTIAVHDTPQEAKEFYGADEVVDAANERLDAVKSAMRLDNASSGNSLTVAGKTLKKVRPKKADSAVALMAEEFANFTFHRCIYIAHKLMGNKNPTGYNSEVVLQNQAGTGLNTAKGTENDTEANYAQSMANYMLTSNNANTDEQTRKGITDKHVGPNIGQQYGTQLANGGLDKRAQELGVNQFARPEVGESYVTATVAATNTKEDYSQPQLGGGPRVIGNNDLTWSYHFAAVVAESLDKADHVTLENYNRGLEQKEKMKEIFDDLIANYKGIMDKAIANMENKGQGSQIKQALAEIYEGAGKSKEEALKKAKAAVDLDSGTMWYFKMIGSGAGQSFHEQQAATGFFANPLTLRVRPHTAENVTIFFERSQATLVNIESNKLKEVVNGLLAAPDRKATVTGYANKKLFNRDNKTLAADRARAVVTYLKSKGVPPTQIDEVNGGDTVTFPAVGTRDKTASTRRVEVVISSS
jgi:outer membrane protein OmpA-like peptidoglycan-associated protein